MAIIDFGGTKEEVVTREEFPLVIYFPLFSSDPGTTHQPVWRDSRRWRSVPRAGASRSGPGTGNPGRYRNPRPPHIQRSGLQPQKNPGTF